MAHHDSIQRLASALATLSLLAAVALPIFAIVGWIFIEDIATISQTTAMTRLVQNMDIALGYRLAGMVVALLGASIMSFGLLSLRRTFLEAVAGRYLSAQSIIGFQRFAWVAVFMVIFGIVQATANIAIFSLVAGGPGQLSIKFGTPEVTALFVALLFVFCGHLFAIGREAEQENASFL